ncbi:MAG: ABC transporter permease [Arachnia sp.]
MSTALDEPTTDTAVVTPSLTAWQRIPRHAKVRLGWIIGGTLGAVIAFLAFCAWQGADPLGVPSAMLSTALLDPGALGQTLTYAVPIGFAALAVAIPARGGLVNVGGEGQLIVGAVAGTGLALAIGEAVAGPLGIVISLAAGAAAGAAWAGLCGFLRVKLNTAEAVTTLLMNFIANAMLNFLIYQPWKDPHGSGQPQSRPIDGALRLPGLFDATTITWAVPLLAAAGIVLWLALAKTGWGFALSVAGANPVAASRQGLSNQRLMLQAMLVGGAMAGLGGALNILGVEGQLRPGITAGLGYVGFLACFVANSRPLRVVLISIGFAAIAMSGNGLQISEGLDGNVVNVALGLIVLAVLIIGGSRRSNS